MVSILFIAGMQVGMQVGRQKDRKAWKEASRKKQFQFKKSLDIFRESRIFVLM